MFSSEDDCMVACLTVYDGDKVWGEGERADRRGASRHYREPALQTLDLSSPAPHITALEVLEASEVSRRLSHGGQEEEEEKDEMVDDNENPGEPESHPAAELLPLFENCLTFYILIDYYFWQFWFWTSWNYSYDKVEIIGGESGGARQLRFRLNDLSLYWNLCLNPTLSKIYLVGEVRSDLLRRLPYPGGERWPPPEQ